MLLEAPLGRHAALVTCSTADGYLGGIQSCTGVHSHPLLALEHTVGQQPVHLEPGGQLFHTLPDMVSKMVLLSPALSNTRERAQRRRSERSWQSWQGCVMQGTESHTGFAPHADARREPVKGSEHSRRPIRSVLTGGDCWVESQSQAESKFRGFSVDPGHLVHQEGGGDGLRIRECGRVAGRLTSVIW